MKKNCINSFLLCRKVKKVLLTMKLTIILLLLCMMQISASVYSQSTKFNFEVKNEDVIKVLKKIEETSNYRFFYISEHVDVNRKVSIEVNNETIKKILEELFEGHDVNYEFVDNYLISLSPKKFKTSEKKILQQQITVSGTVTDPSGSPLPGVTVIVKGTTQGTVTNADGEYSLSNIPEDAALQFSFVGMKTQEVEVGSQTTIDIIMVADAIGIEEVVAIGYGTMKKSDLTGSVANVSSLTISEVPSLNVLENFQGRVAGVDIVNNNGAPGAGSTIRIRGNRSISADNNPLIVIDGIPSMLDLNDIASEDIESIDILKDASAAAIYGSRAANGVIMITSKRGKKGVSAKVSYNGYYGIKTAINNVDVMNGEEFAEYKRVAYGNPVGDVESALSATELEGYRNGVSTDWMDLVLQNGNQQNHQLSVEGGSEKIRYYTSVNYYDEEGVLTGGDYKRLSFRANLDIKVSEKFNFGITSYLSGSIQNVQNTYAYEWAVWYSPLSEPKDENGRHVPDPNGDGLIFNPTGYMEPGAYIDERRRQQYMVNLFGEYKIIDGLKYRFNLAPSFVAYRKGYFEGTAIKGGVNSASMQMSNTLDYTIENILNYTKDIKEHTINLTAVFSSQENRYEELNGSAQDYPVEEVEFYNLNATTNVNTKGVGSSLSEWGLLSWAGRVNYDFKDKYYFTATGRWDGSSRLADGNKWSFFPSLATKWRISNEAFMEELLAFSDLALRASYGEVGNTSISPYTTQGGLSSTIYNFGSVAASGYQPGSIPNPYLGWETSKTLNLALDFGLFDSRIFGSLEVYNTKTEHLLLSRALPYTSGYSTTLQNIGSTRNRGIELTLNSINIDNGNGFKWSTELNFFKNKEEIVSLFNDTDDNIANGWFIGHPIDVFYTYVFDGIWQLDEAVAAAEYGYEPGDVKLKDINGRDENGELTGEPDGIINGDDRMIIGDPRPNWSGGMTNRFSYKGFDLSVFVFARQGQMLKSEYHKMEEGRFNMIKLNYWSPENPSNEYPNPGSHSDAEIDAVKYFDGSYVKIKNITFGYNFGKTLTEKLSLSSLRIYFTANNPIFWSKYDLRDPEVSGSSVGPTTALSARGFMFGINAKF